MRAPTSLDVIRGREFRLLFAGQAISLLGDGMVLVALSFAVLDLTGSVSDLGFVLAARSIPVVVVILAGGVIADRVPRRAVMVGADLVRLGSHATAGALLIAQTAHIWELAVLMACSGAGGGFFYPASSGLLPMTVASEQLQQANALRVLATSAGQIAGPAISGLLVTTAGPGWALVVDAATFGVSATSLALLHLPRHVRPPRQHFLRDLQDGWRAFTARTWVWAVVLVAGGLGNVFGAAFAVLGPAIAKRDLGGAGAWALILSAQGIGAVVGGLLILNVRVGRPAVAANVGWALLAVANSLLAARAPLLVIAAGALVSGGGLATANSIWETALQRHIPPEALSRVTSYDWFGSLALQPVGLVLVGPVAGAVGATAALAIAAAWFVSSSLGLVALPSVRTVRG